VKTIYVKNWDKFQPKLKRDRGRPTWIRLHLNLLNDINFICLDSEQQLDLIKIWLMNAESGDGTLPADSEKLGLLIRAGRPVNVSALEAAGFVGIGKPPVADRGSWVKAVPAKSDGSDAKRIFDYWNELIEKPKAVTMTKARRESIEARIKEHGTDAVLLAVRNRAESVFLSNGMRGGPATIDWVMGPKNFAKVVDGNYNGGGVAGYEFGAADQMEADRSVRQRGLDPERVSEADRWELLARDLNTVKAAALKSRKDLVGMTSTGMVAWFVSSYQQHPYNASIEASLKEGR
jgi:hypothetical protein